MSENVFIKKAEECRSGIIKSYKHYQNISNFISKVECVEETDNKFTPITLRTLVDAIWFTSPSHITDFWDIGMSVARGETKFMIETIIKQLKSNKPENITKMNKNGFSSKKLIEFICSNWNIGSINARKTVVLCPIDIKYDILLNDIENVGYDNGMESFFIEVKKIKLKLFGITEDMLKDKIIIMDKDNGIWKYKKHDDDIIQVLIKILEKNSTKVDIIARTIIKFDIMNFNKIKIMEIE